MSQAQSMNFKQQNGASIGMNSGTQTAPYFGSLISLISKSEIRFEGYLVNIDEKDSVVTLKNVRSFGTEGRGGKNIPASTEEYSLINFKVSEIKDLQVSEVPTSAAPTATQNQPFFQQQQQPQASPAWGSFGSNGGNPMFAPQFPFGAMGKNLMPEGQDMFDVGRMGGSADDANFETFGAAAASNSNGAGWPLPQMNQHLIPNPGPNATPQQQYLYYQQQQQQYQQYLQFQYMQQQYMYQMQMIQMQQLREQNGAAAVDNASTPAQIVAAQQKQEASKGASQAPKQEAKKETPKTTTATKPEGKSYASTLTGTKPVQPVAQKATQPQPQSQSQPQAQPQSQTAAVPRAAQKVTPVAAPAPTPAPVAAAKEAPQTMEELARELLDPDAQLNKRARRQKKQLLEQMKANGGALPAVDLSKKPVPPGAAKAKPAQPKSAAKKQLKVVPKKSAGAEVSAPAPSPAPSPAPAQVHVAEPKVVSQYSAFVQQSGAKQQPTRPNHNVWKNPSHQPSLQQQQQSQAQSQANALSAISGSALPALQPKQQQPRGWGQPLTQAQPKQQPQLPQLQPQLPLQQQPQLPQARVVSPPANKPQIVANHQQAPQASQPSKLVNTKPSIKLEEFDFDKSNSRFDKSKLSSDLRGPKEDNIKPYVKISFFDNLSCESLEAIEDKKGKKSSIPNARDQRRIDDETFGSIKIPQPPTSAPSSSGQYRGSYSNNSSSSNNNRSQSNSSGNSNSGYRSHQSNASYSNASSNSSGNNNSSSGGAQSRSGGQQQSRNANAWSTVRS